jgi:hypothetical protein
MGQGFSKRTPVAGRRGWLSKGSALVGLAALSLVVSVSSAEASVTIGQFVAAPEGCAPDNDWAQLSPASGNPYTVPGEGTITSWSTIAGAGAGQTMSMKLWRPVFDKTYTLVGHDGPRMLTASALNTFPASVPVRPGDVLGLHSGSPTAPSACLSPITPEDSLLGRLGDAADDESPSFTSTYMRHLNITADFEPSNSFEIGAITRNKTRGTANLTVNVPNPGELTGSGNGVKAASGGRAAVSKPVDAGPARLLVKARGKKKKTLKKKGSVKLNVAVTYTPTGGDPRTQSVKVKLKKKH